MKKSKYETQQKHIRKNYVRFPLDLKPETLDIFKEKCEKNGSTATTEIKKFIDEYCKNN